MPTYPIILTQLDQARVIVIGGGSVAERKIAGLIEGGACPVVICPTITAALAAWHAEGKITWQARPYAEGDLAGAALAIAATNVRGVNAAVADEARRRGVLANISDAPEEGGWTTTATVRRGDLLIAATTNGASPSLTAAIRRELEAAYGDEYAALLSLLRQIRAGPARSLPPAARTALLRRLASREALALVRGGQHEQIAQIVAQALAEAAPEQPHQTPKEHTHE